MLERISEKLNKAGVDNTWYFYAYHLFWHTLLYVGVFTDIKITLGVLFLGLIILAKTQA